MLDHVEFAPAFSVVIDTVEILVIKTSLKKVKLFVKVTKSVPKNGCCLEVPLYNGGQSFLNYDCKCN